MKKAYLILAISVFVSQQEAFKKRDLYGVYRQETGEPGRTIIQSDSSEIHLSPMVYSWTELELKSWSRWEERSSFDGENPFCLRGSWTFDGDSIYLYFKNDSLYQTYAPQGKNALLGGKGRTNMYRLR